MESPRNQKAHLPRRTSLRRKTTLLTRRIRATTKATRRPVLLPRRISLRRKTTLLKRRTRATTRRPVLLKRRPVLLKRRPVLLKRRTSLKRRTTLLPLKARKKVHLPRKAKSLMMEKRSQKRRAIHSRRKNGQHFHHGKNG